MIIKLFTTCSSHDTFPPIPIGFLTSLSLPCWELLLSSWSSVQLHLGHLWVFPAQHYPVGSYGLRCPLHTCPRLLCFSCWWTHANSLSDPSQNLGRSYPDLAIFTWLPTHQWQFTCVLFILSATTYLISHPLLPEFYQDSSISASSLGPRGLILYTAITRFYVQWRLRHIAHLSAPELGGLSRAFGHCLALLPHLPAFLLHPTLCLCRSLRPGAIWGWDLSSGLRPGPCTHFALERLYSSVYSGILSWPSTLAQSQVFSCRSIWPDGEQSESWEDPLPLSLASSLEIHISWVLTS